MPEKLAGVRVIGDNPRFHAQSFATQGRTVIFIFGWEKQTKPLGEVGKLYCFECKRATPWVAVDESQWLTLFFIRVLKFINKRRLHCSGCGAVLHLGSGEFKQMDSLMRQRDSIAGTQLHAALTRRIEQAQLAGKTATQIKFIRESLRHAEQGRRAANDASNKGEMR